MKKKIALFVANILLILISFFIVEIVIWHKENDYLRRTNTFPKTMNQIGFHEGITKFNIDLNYFPTPENGYGRAPEGLKYKKKPITIFGCSYAYGYKLNNEETFSYKLAHSAKRPVYNQSFTGWGIQHMLYQSKLEGLYSKVPEPEYVIYVYINDHIRRLYLISFSSWNILAEQFNLRYKSKNNQLVEIRNQNPVLNQIKRLYFVNKLQNTIVNKQIARTKNPEKHYDFAVEHFVSAKNEMQKHWKNSKFVVLFYDSVESDKYLRDKLEKNNFIIVVAEKLISEDLTKEEFITEDKCHPNEKAWDLITPALIRELNL